MKFILIFFLDLAEHPAAGRKVSSTDPTHTYLFDIIDFSYEKIWKDKTFLHQKYVAEGLSIAQIVRETFSSRAAIRNALIEFGIKRRQRGKPGLRPAQVPYGYRRLDGLMVRHEGEQRVLSVVEKMNRKGMSLREICELLTSIGVPTKRRGQRWHPEMVKRILNRLQSLNIDTI